jgi:hypothetical protein
MAKREQIRAVGRAICLAEGLLAIFAAVGDELAAAQDETTNAAMLDTALGELASAKYSAEAALAALRQWVRDAEAGSSRLLCLSPTRIARVGALSGPEDRPRLLAAWQGP